MLHIILGTLGLFVFQSLLPLLIHYFFSGPGVGERLKWALGPRDEKQERSDPCERAQRAFNNLREAMPVFITLALLSLHFDKSEEALLGAQVFLGARVLYIPVYMSGIPMIRTLVWTGSWVGLAMMIATLLA